MWDRFAVAAGLALASLAFLAARPGPASAAPSMAPEPVQTTVTMPAGSMAAPSLADAVAALSLAQRTAGETPSAEDALAETVASSLAHYLTPLLTPAAASPAPQAAAMRTDPGALGGLLDSGDALGVIIPFSAQGRDGRLHNGLTFAVAAGGQVFSPVDATVGFSGPLDGYGEVAILLTRDGAALVVTGMANALPQEGDKLRAGALLGRMPGQPGASPARDGLTSSATPAPELYIEVRKAGQFIDPALWLR